MRWTPRRQTWAAVRRAQECSPISVLRLVQALQQARPDGSPSCWLREAPNRQENTRRRCRRFSLPCGGLGCTIPAAENSEVWGGQVDLDPSDAPATSAGETLLRQMADQSGEDQVAFRGGVRRVLRLVRWDGSRQAREKIPVRSDAAYLITGGLGGIGLALAQWFAAQGARRLVLAGRAWSSHPVPSGTGRVFPRRSPSASKRFASWRRRARAFSPCRWIWVTENPSTISFKHACRRTCLHFAAYSTPRASPRASF